MGIIKLAIDTLEMNKQALIFVNTKRSAEKLAEDISKKIKLNNELKDFSKKILGDAPTKQCTRLSNIVKKGVAFHHSGLKAFQRDLIEDSFRRGIVRIIVSTPTLAAGLDLPAFRVIIRDLRRYEGGSLKHIPVLEFLQMAGRAGRPKYDSYGEAIIIAKSEAEAEFLIDNYIYGEPEEIYSKLSVEPILRTYALALISTMFITDEDNAIDFFSETFWAHQFRDLSALEIKLDKVINQLIEWDFIERVNGKLIATQLGKRVSELYLDPLTAHSFVEALHKAKNKQINEFSLLQLVSYTLEMRPLVKAKAKDQIDLHREIIINQHYLLTDEPNVYDFEYDEFLNSVKTALMFLAWINEDSEDNIMNDFSIRPGELHRKLDTVDWLLMALAEIALIIKFKDIIKHINKLRLRIKYGAKEELLALLKLKGIGRVFARRLYAKGFKSLGDLRKAPLKDIEAVVGKKRAQDIKQQLGIKEEKEKSLDSF